jgi:hypothetical protein
MARPARGPTSAFRSPCKLLRAVVARLLGAEAPALSPGERDRALGRSTRSTGVGDHARDEPVDLVRLLDLPNLPMPGRVDVGRDVQDVGGENGVAHVGSAPAFTVS